MAGRAGVDRRGRRRRATPGIDLLFRHLDTPGGIRRPCGAWASRARGRPRGRYLDLEQGIDETRHRLVGRSRPCPRRRESHAPIGCLLQVPRGRVGYLATSAACPPLSPISTVFASSSGMGGGSLNVRIYGRSSARSGSIATSAGWSSTGGCCRRRSTSGTRCWSGVKFLAIFSSNLDEFFQKRMGDPAAAARGRQPGRAGASRAVRRASGR